MVTKLLEEWVAWIWKMKRTKISLFSKLKIQLKRSKTKEKTRSSRPENPIILAKVPTFGNFLLKLRLESKLFLSLLNMDMTLQLSL